MTGIVSFGVYIPIYRLRREALNQIWGLGGRGERAVANYDEDSITMAVEAGRNCLQGMDKKDIGALYFASTTSPYKEKQSSSIIAAALDLRENIITADFANSLRSGTIALKSALDSVTAGSAKSVLVIASDCRIPPPDTQLESLFGDGAAALLIGEDGASTEILSSYYLSSEFIDIWRLDNDRMVRTWEDRFIREEGYVPHLEKAVTGLLEASRLTAKDFNRAAFYAPTEQLHRYMGEKLGLDIETQVQDPLFDHIGNTGTAFALMILIGALEESKAGHKILFANYGDGAEAHFLQVVKKINNKNGLRENLESKLYLNNYGKYIKFRGLMDFQKSHEFEQRTSLPQLWRDRRWVYRLHGHQCEKCGKVQFPMQLFCIYCQAPEEFLREIPLSDKRGRLFTYSTDERAPVIDKPNVLGVVDLEGGGRFFSQITDRDISTLDVGIPMELTFRRIHESMGLYNYFWKCRPARQ